MAKSDIIFVFPPAPGTIGAFKRHLGVAYLRAALAHEGMTTDQYVSEKPRSVNAVAADIIGRKSPIVGFTVYDANARLCIAIARSIKRQKPGIRVLFGGPTATFSARALMERHEAIDACVMGEAEETAAQIFAKLLDGSALDDAQPGVVFRDHGDLVCTALPPLVESGRLGIREALDSTPSPYLSGILADGREGVLTSRGCTHHCQYCCFAALARQRLRLHSIERVVAELEYIVHQQKRTGERYPVAFLDDAFTLLLPRTKGLCRAIAERKLDLVLSCSTRADNVDEELLELMREAGFGTIAFGLESAVPSVLRAMGKVRPPDWPDPDLAPESQFVERVRSSVLLARKNGFNVGVSIILGLPTETPADGAETLRFVKELRVDSYAHNFLWVFPGTPLWTTHDKYGINCTVDKNGLSTTTDYAYDLKTLKPGPRCELEQEAHLLRLLATDALYGCEASSAAGDGISSVIIETGELSKELADWLHDILTVGGVVVQVYPGVSRNTACLYRDRGVLSEYLIPAMRYIQVQAKKASKNGDATWKVSGAGVDVYQTHKPALLTIRTSGGANPLIAWSKSQEPKANVCEICKYLKHPGELVHIMDRIDEVEMPSPLRRMPTPPHVKYPGRWLPGRAPCSSLTRIEVSAQGDVRCCRHGRPIGKIGHSKEALAQRLTDLASAVERRRGCAECRNTNCPRCPFPGTDDLMYCQTMNKQERALQALNWINLYSRLPLVVALQRIN